ncbi:MAG: flavin reductase [Leptospiraceae bacterium]|nr:flavin reductase [Leptospiraceae bacterium]MDW7975530.1 hypothetical protein [Leptospiraceae bacterium]
MLFSLDKLSIDEKKQLLGEVLIPRPIALILTKSGEERYSLSNISFFSIASYEPALLFFLIERKPDGSKKQTWLNIEERIDFSLFFLNETLQQKLHSKIISDQEEWELPQEELNYDKKISPLPILKESYLAFFCEKYQIIEIGDIPNGLILGKIKSIYVDNQFLENSKEINIKNPAELRSIVKIGLNKTISLIEIAHGVSKDPSN